jgi:branched-chain amino acid transport system substrate-binding protein
VSLSGGAVLTPAGLDKSIGILSANYGKDPTDPQWDNDPEMLEWRAFMKKYYPDGNLTDASNTYGYAAARTLVQVLKQCGDNLTRENVMKQAANLKDFDTGMSLPGIKINTGPKDYAPIEGVQLMRFDGKSWVRFGPVISADAR